MPSAIMVDGIFFVKRVCFYVDDAGFASGGYV